MFVNQVLIYIVELLRWWSECAATWRDKWSKLRVERNTAVEESGEMRREVYRLEVDMDRVR